MRHIYVGFLVALLLAYRHAGLTLAFAMTMMTLFIDQGFS